MSAGSREIETTIPELDITYVEAGRVHNYEEYLGKLGCLTFDIQRGLTAQELSKRHKINENLGSHVGPAYEAYCSQKQCSVGVSLKVINDPDTGEAFIYDYPALPLGRPLEACNEAIS